MLERQVKRLKNERVCIICATFYMIKQLNE